MLDNYYKFLIVHLTTSGLELISPNFNIVTNITPSYEFYLMIISISSDSAYISYSQDIKPLKSPFFPLRII